MSAHSSDMRAAIVGSAVAVEGGLAVVALALGWLFGLVPLAEISATLTASLAGLAAAAPIFLGLVLIDRIPFGPLARLERLVRHTLVPLFRSCSFFELALICALAGFGEELFFRGVVQAGLARLFASPWLALAGASLLFGLAHPITPTYIVVAAVIGAYLGWLYMASGNLWVPIVAHAAYDLAALVYLLRDGSGPSPAPPAAEDDVWSI